MKIAVVGAGTILFRDEGIGVYAQRYLYENYTFDADVTIVDGGVLGFGLMTYYTEYDRVLILDTITMKDEAPGTLYNIPAHELLGLGSYKQTAHEVEIVEMLEIAALNGNLGDVHIIGIVPEDILSVKIGLSNTMIRAFDDFVATAISELQRNGVKVLPKEKPTSLEKILSNYQDPQSECKRLFGS